MSEIALVCPHLVVRGVTGCLIDAALMLAACWLLTLAPPSDRLPGLFMKQRHIHLVACLKTVPTANRTGGWRHPEADLNDTFARERCERIAPILEAACCN